MRFSIALYLGLLSSVATCQEWALINPSYKYNFSNDGTDTIRYQVKVMDQLVLGPDSLSFALNRTADLCLDCWPDCTLRMGIPQFLGGSCTRSGDTWTFEDPFTRVIHSTAQLGETWLFEPESGTSASLVGIEELDILGAMDSVRTLVTEMGDTVSWCKELGLVRWSIHNGETLQLIGVHGPQRGVLIPGFGDFFPYQPGDIVETHLYQMSGNNSASQQFTYRKHEILERIEVSPEHLIFNTRFFSRVENYTGQYTMFGYGLETWDMDPADVLQSPLHSSPNELIELGGHLWSNWNNLVPVMQMVASHYRDSLGHYVIESKPGEWGTLFSIEGAPDTMGCVDLLDDISTVGGGYRLDDLLGVRLRLFVNLPYRRSFSTEGAVLGGDTIGTVHDDLFFHVGIDDSVSRRSILSPTVASDNVILTLDPPQPTTWSIRSLDGKEIRTGRTQGGTTNVLTVADLAPGVYILQLDEQHPTWHRFIVQH